MSRRPGPSGDLTKAWSRRESRGLEDVLGDINAMLDDDQESSDREFLPLPPAEHVDLSWMDRQHEVKRAPPGPASGSYDNWSPAAIFGGSTHPGPALASTAAAAAAERKVAAATVTEVAGHTTRRPAAPSSSKPNSTRASASSRARLRIASKITNRGHATFSDGAATMIQSIARLHLARAQFTAGTTRAALARDAEEEAERAKREAEVARLKREAGAAAEAARAAAEDAAAAKAARLAAEDEAEALRLRLAEQARARAEAAAEAAKALAVEATRLKKAEEEEAEAQRLRLAAQARAHAEAAAEAARVVAAEALAIEAAARRAAEQEEAEAERLRLEEQVRVGAAEVAEAAKAMEARRKEQMRLEQQAKVLAEAKAAKETRRRKHEYELQTEVNARADAAEKERVAADLAEKMRDAELRARAVETERTLAALRIQIVFRARFARRVVQALRDAAAIETKMACIRAEVKAADEANAAAAAAAAASAAASLGRVAEDAARIAKEHEAARVEQVRRNAEAEAEAEAEVEAKANRVAQRTSQAIINRRKLEQDESELAKAAAAAADEVARITAEEEEVRRQAETDRSANAAAAAAVAVVQAETKRRAMGSEAAAAAAAVRVEAEAKRRAVELQAATSYKSERLRAEHEARTIAIAEREAEMLQQKVLLREESAQRERVARAETERLRFKEIRKRTCDTKAEADEAQVPLGVPLDALEIAQNDRAAYPQVNEMANVLFDVETNSSNSSTTTSCRGSREAEHEPFQAQHALVASTSQQLSTVNGSDSVSSRFGNVPIRRSRSTTTVSAESFDAAPTTRVCFATRGGGGRCASAVSQDRGPFSTEPSLNHHPLPRAPPRIVDAPITADPSTLSRTDVSDTTEATPVQDTTTCGDDDVRVPARTRVTGRRRRRMCNAFDVASSSFVRHEHLPPGSGAMDRGIVDDTGPSDALSKHLEAVVGSRGYDMSKAAGGCVSAAAPSGAVDRCKSDGNTVAGHRPDCPGCRVCRTSASAPMVRHRSSQRPQLSQPSRAGVRERYRDDQQTYNETAVGLASRSDKNDVIYAEADPRPGAQVSLVPRTVFTTRPLGERPGWNRHFVLERPKGTGGRDRLRQRRNGGGIGGGGGGRGPLQDVAWRVMNNRRNG
jgi:hypothetical protein